MCKNGQNIFGSFIHWGTLYTLKPKVAWDLAGLFLKWLESSVVPQNHTLTRPNFSPRTCFLNDKFSALDEAGPLKLTGITQNAPLELPAK